MRNVILASAGLVLGSILTAAPFSQTEAASSVRTFSLYLLGHQIGEERRTETSSASSRRLTFDFKYNDRGTEVALASTLELGSKGEPLHFVTKGRTYRYFSADSEVTIIGTRAHVRDGIKETDIDFGGKPFFPFDNYAPIGVHEELIKYWLARGRPAEILTAPAGPVRISLRGGNRLAIDGAVWGRETAFVDLEPDRFRGRISGLFSWAGGLGFEAVANTNEGRYDEMAKLAVADRMDDLRAWTKETTPVRSGTYAVTGATIVDGTDRPPIANATMLIRDGRIADVGPAVSTTVPAGVATVDAKGQFIIPGLWDMHAHVTQIDWFPSYLASGVTTIRDMGGEFEFLKAAKDVIAAGALAPRLLAAGLIDGPGPRAFGRVSVSTPDEARAAVRKYHDAGFEEIKVYIIVPPALVPVITDEAHKLGMTVTGHVPTGMTAQQVVEQGFDSIAHMQLRGQPGSPEAAASIAFFKQHGTVMDPTQSWNEFLNRSTATPLSAIQPNAATLPPALARLLSGVTLSNADPIALRARQIDSYRLLKQAVDAGLLVVAGTDKGVPGMSVQRELELYVMGGMTPLQALQSATVVPARVVKLDKELGTLEVGKRADFVILGANPLENISAIREARRVATNGRLYETGPLWKLAGFR